MGQFNALLFKQWSLTKKQRVSFCCQIFTPMFSLGLVWAIVYVVNNTDLTTTSNSDSDLDPEGIIPSYIYAGYIANAQTRSYPPLNYYNNWNANRIFRYGYSDTTDTQLKDKVVNMFNNQIPNLDFWFWNSTDWVTSPMFNFTQGMDSPTSSNQVLVKDLKSVQAVPNNQIENYVGVADAVLVFNSSARIETGFNIHMQTNNVASSRIHRTNGISRINMVNPQNSSTMIAPVVVTEGYIGTMNYMTNKFLESMRQLRSRVLVQSYVSLTFDSSSIQSLLQNGVAGLSIVFFPVALTMGFPLLLYSLVLEAEERILTLLKINGLDTKVYWISIYAFYFILFTAITTIFSVIGWNLLDVIFFTDVPKLLLTIFFLGWNFSQISFGIFLSTMISASIWANLIGYLMSVLLLLALSGISLTVFPNPSVFPYYFYILPHSAFVRFFYSITFDCVSQDCPSTVFDVKEDSLRSLVALWIVGFGYTFLAYFAHKLQRFFAEKSAPAAGRKSITPADRDVTSNQGSGASARHDPENMMPEQLALSETTKDPLRAPLVDHVIEGWGGTEFDPTDPRYAVVAIDLQKIYPNGKKALTNFSIRMRKDKVFGLLGPNGAGKTTFLSILSGALEKSGGEVYFESQPVRYGERNDAKMGFCPQFDILWPNLSVLEHFHFFTLFKGYKPKNGMKKYVRELASALDLTDARHKKSSQLSGGMKRRVSLGCAIAGEPSVIFLDEPSSGLDPVRRREFWDLIKKVGKGKAVVLTTHLMEEADVLSDEIGIMTSGQLRAIGTPNVLKEQYGGGMKVNVMLTEASKLAEVDELLSKAFEGSCTKSWMFDRSVTFTLIPKGSHKRIMIKIFEIARVLQTQNLIEDWSISQGSLEEVFLRVLEQSGQKKFAL